MDCGEVSDWAGTNRTLTKFWRIRVPDIIKLVTWRILHNSLPVAKNLLRRGCSVDPSCIFCGFKVEDARHIFINCWWYKCLWISLGIKNKVWHTSDTWTIDDTVWYIISYEDSKTLQLIVISFWFIWFCGNSTVHGKQPMYIAGACFKIKHYLNHFESRHMIGLHSQPYCNPTECNGIQFFCDGSWAKNSRIGGWSAIAVDGNAILRCRTCFNLNCDLIFQ